MITVTIYDMETDGWSGLLEADPADIIGSLNELYDLELGKVVREAGPEEEPDPENNPLDSPSKILVIEEKVAATGEWAIFTAVAV